MGLVYTILLQDDFDWHYVKTSKEKELKKFEKKFKELIGYYPDKLGEWYGHAVYDIDKNPPYFQPLFNLIEKSCDITYYWDDSKPYEKIKLDLLE